MMIKGIDNQQLIDALKRYHDMSFTPGIYEHSIFGQAAILLEKSLITCKDCVYYKEKRVVAVCNHPHGLKNPTQESYCCYANAK